MIYEFKRSVYINVNSRDEAVEEFANEHSDFATGATVIKHPEICPECLSKMSFQHDKKKDILFCWCNRCSTRYTQDGKIIL